MSDWPYVEGSINSRQGTVSSAAAGVQRTWLSGASANVKGSYVILATTATDADGFFFETNWGNGDSLADLSILSQSGTVDVVQNIYRSQPQFLMNNTFWPITVPAGSSVGIRAQSANAPSQLWGSIHFTKGGLDALPPLSLSETWGAVPGTTLGTFVNSGGTAFTKGAWAQLVASSARHCRAVILNFQWRGNAGRGGSDFYLVDLGVGAAGSEAVVIPDIPVAERAGNVMPATHGPFYIEIPANSRVAIRANWDGQVNSTFYATAYGLA
mgnify:CR=1 FL=1